MCSSDLIEPFRDKLIEGMLSRGYERAFAEQIYRQIQGFGEYGFPESHAASFALLVYVSAWLKRHHPAAFTAALLNSQGTYVVFGKITKGLDVVKTIIGLNSGTGDLGGVPSRDVEITTVSITEK